MIYSFDVATGKLRGSSRRTRAAVGGRHRKNTYASETPATDGERVYALFGNIGCSATRWTARCSGRTRSTRSRAISISAPPRRRRARRPRLLSTTTRKLVHRRARRQDRRRVWKTPRTAAADVASGWSTPYVWVNAQRTEIVAIGRQSPISYDTDGKELWRLKGATQANPTPTEGEGMLFVGTGLAGGIEPADALRSGRAPRATSR
jgi:hypothetical protein